MGSVSRLLYQLAFGTALAGAAPVLLARRGRHYLPTLSGRLGWAAAPGSAGGNPALGHGGLWIHAVSVGEVAVAATLVRALPPGLPLLVTTTTPTGQARARAAFAGRAAVAYFPFDLGFAVRALLDRFAPRALLLVEGDYWPLVLSEARRRRMAVAVVNGRVGDRGFRRMRRLRPLLGPLFAPVRRFAVQTGQDRERLLALGVPAEAVAVTGNLKYETPEPLPLPALEEPLRELAAGRPLIVAGSTMRGEDEKVLDAFAAAGGGAAALLVIAPRHPERWDEVAALLAARGFATLRRSRLGERPPGRTDAVLLDSLGELAALYRSAAAAFIGGTLVPTGGHNPLEAARFGVPVAVGPSMHNFRDMAEQFDRAGAWRRVGSGAELGAAFRDWLERPESGREVGARAAALLAENRGAVARSVAWLAPVLAGSGLDLGPDGAP
jgi:3-deoxy-D-manno-octulosonic-acid transferase